MVDNRRSCKRQELGGCFLFSVLRLASCVDFFLNLFLFTSDPGSSFIIRAVMKEAELDYILLQSCHFSTLELYDILVQYERRGNVHGYLVNVIRNVHAGEWGYMMLNDIGFVYNVVIHILKRPPPPK